MLALGSHYRTLRVEEAQVCAAGAGAQHQKHVARSNPAAHCNGRPDFVLAARLVGGSCIGFIETLLAHLGGGFHCAEM